jgi:hypothetical protein
MNIRRKPNSANLYWSRWVTALACIVAHKSLEICERCRLKSFLARTELVASAFV